VPAWKRCFSSSPQTSSEKEQPDDHHRPAAACATDATDATGAHARAPPCPPRLPRARPAVQNHPRRAAQVPGHPRGFWLLASIGIASGLATGAVIAFAPTDQFSYSTFTLAIGVPMSVILPMVAILSVTAEWSQRSGLTTFTLVPHRGRILVGKAIAAVAIAVASMLVAFPVGALGNVIGSAIHGVPTVWDQGVVDVLYMVGGNTLVLMVGFMLGVLIRSSTPALVAYLIYAFVAPTLLTFLAINQKWFADLQPWVDPNYSQDALLQGGFSGEQ
jgi:ABC-2 type transport system permease protein